MDAFNAVCPEGKTVSCIDDLKTFTVVDFKKILKASISMAFYLR